MLNFVVLLCCVLSHCRKPKYDLDKMDGPHKRALPVLGNVLELLTPNFHRKASSSSRAHSIISNRVQSTSSSRMQSTSSRRMQSTSSSRLQSTSSSRAHSSSSCS
jgi:hypothetical protein